MVDYFQPVPWLITFLRVDVGFHLATAAGVARAGPKSSFFIGIKIRHGILGPREEQETHWRGGEEAFLADDDDDETGESYTVGLEMVMDDW
ncbi:hypothetical protein N658DRAFT_504562 [Parathielavia hyrcaniae]|uniref:Uncharacterized protein n=1 Tax=Parathielavia hyrcaniae TaxID=113614 RepID=A0AAN6QA66_9PEZI|nr:hypothetical protein N658DRAFT_504562 [Parathielavia hyrcaniae]